MGAESRVLSGPNSSAQSPTSAKLMYAGLSAQVLSVTSATCLADIGLFCIILVSD